MDPEIGEHCKSKLTFRTTEGKICQTKTELYLMNGSNLKLAHVKWNIIYSFLVISILADSMEFLSWCLL